MLGVGRNPRADFGDKRLKAHLLLVVCYIPLRFVFEVSEPLSLSESGRYCVMRPPGEDYRAGRCSPCDMSHLTLCIYSVLRAERSTLSSVTACFFCCCYCYYPSARRDEDEMCGVFSLVRLLRHLLIPWKGAKPMASSSSSSSSSSFCSSPFPFSSSFLGILLVAAPPPIRLHGENCPLDGKANNNPIL